jgi:hypothetical protein
MVSKNNNEELVEQLHSVLGNFFHGLYESCHTNHDECLNNNTENTKNGFVVMEN